ncbi:tRNA(Phe) (7-(3-amino-3-carboxypropyl)wyosine(37)-O)-methyltransferase [Alteripontixanthobacter maritimus]|uniref:tRNA(Phe) (7-(3-amino-3-carboxypropyl)wyosine(37)-O)-methyltransferase n=1 Tax=Alteripontixanthobacter maritimus TaxID=2161824 RepID=A0A369Q2D0_9SPHN|nr:cupin-like domain-containing protein [Alteripontixanthobacter maritimus]RDC59061.1 tRNA(Phe) (7-(3-amino-3-carboxypropyl)wyosine(37)-O)-methyltransferase [Alteripontixanthobacter maritimus]
MQAVQKIPLPSPATFEKELRDQYQPLVMRGAAADWPLVEAAQRSPDEALAMVRSADTGQPADIMLTVPEEKGRFFYNAEMTGFNFARKQATLTQLVDELQRQTADAAQPNGIYAGATPMRSHVPSLMAANPFPLAETLDDATARLWLGNATQVATHFDMSDNFAVVALGKRRFTLFPPAATKDLYVGPFDNTPAGQPVSMVDPLAPDMDRYPRYAAALEQAQFADLEAGDAIYVPTLWWHHVAASTPVNILVNYWHNDAAHGGGFMALMHALLSIRDLPAVQREAWRAWFDHFIFDADAPAAADHLPPAAQGIRGPASNERDAMMRQYIARTLMR